MKQSIVSPAGVPTANLAINKSRIKLYNTTGSMPTYYLEKNQEFQIELFNPTSTTVLAKIHLNGTAIAQGGLVLRPGERVFLDRYIDVAKKFLFDTYSVSNSSEVQKAIKDNGDFKVEFYKESIPLNYGNPIIINYNSTTGNAYNQGLRGNAYNTGTFNSAASNYNHLTGSITTIAGIGQTTTCTTSNGNFKSSSLGLTTMDFLDNQEREVKPLGKRLKSKAVETGRVEMGSDSTQKLKTVSKSFDYYAFHTVECKMLPLSQKINTSEDLNVKRYCSNCGAKHKANFKFCPTCGTKA